jgi:sugar phosphate isomerase/epimerase
MELSTYISSSLRLLLPEYGRRLGLLTAAGFRIVDFSFTEEMQSSGKLPACLPHIRQAAQEKGVRFGQAHSSGGNPLLPGMLEKTQRLVGLELQGCAYLGIPRMVVHPGARPENGKEEFFERNVEFYRSLIPFAEETGVEILIENIGSPGDPYFLRTGKELREMVEAVNHPLVGACWDSGHANHNRQCGQYESITALGSRLRAVHIQDNFGSFELQQGCWRADLHTLPFFGNTNYDSVMQGLKDIGYSGTLNFEADAPRVGFERLPFIHNGEELNRLAVLPLEIIESVYRLLWQIGNHLLASYGMAG